MEALFSSLLGNVDWYEIWLATLDTLLMLGGSLLFTILLGLLFLFFLGPLVLGTALYLRTPEAADG